MRNAKAKQKEVEELMAQLVAKAEENSQKFLKDCGAIEEKPVEPKTAKGKQPALGKRKRKN
jgi:hypothetical protein